MGDTSIQWTDKTWNPVTGCTKVSAGCKNCYAERVFPRAYGKDRKFTDVRTHEDRLDQPLRWRKPARVFVNSMSDLFHEDVPDVFIVECFSMMALAYWHTFQILTKRPERMREFVSRYDVGLLSPFMALESGGGITIKTVWQALDRKRRDKVEFSWPLPNVWLGVSVEDQKTADERIPILQKVPAAIRFVSYEPALGQIDITEHLMGMTSCGRPDWLIVGGESGPSARPFDLAWAIDIVRQCKAAGTAVFVKQLGARPIAPTPVCHIECHCGLHYGFRDRKGGEMSEWPEGLRVREFPR